MTKKMLASLIGLALLAEMSGIDNPTKREMKPPRKVTPPIPKGCKVWHEHGGVIAINEKSAIKKFNKLKSNP